MASENYFDLNLCFDVASPHNLQQMGNKSSCDVPNELSENILEDENHLRFIEVEENEHSELRVRSNLQTGNESDVSNSERTANKEPDKLCDASKRPTLLKHETPKLGMEFNDVETAYNFYNRYGEKMGFSTKKDNVRKLEGVVKFRSFCCSKEGFRVVDKRDANVVNHRPETRTGCRATMHIRLHKNGKFKITKLELEHNHALASPGKTHMLRSHKKLGKVHKSLIDAADKSGLTPKQAFDFQAVVAGGRENLGCLSADVKNYLRTKRQKEMEKGDVASLMQYFHDKQLENKSFYSTFQVDNEEQITNIFWADAKGIVDYSHFGDVVCFDTTYKINNYGRHVAPILGINHHKQTIIFAMALLYDETKESFEWLFECFLKVMSGVQPKTILTDQCAAMANAIKKVLPNTHPRLCIWHIYQNACTHLSSVFAASRSFASDFSSCIYDHEIEEDFVKAWNDMLKEYYLVGNKWLNDLFGKKEKWALVYGRNTFCADMMSTQRSESINAVLKRYLNSQYNLLRFFEHYDRLLTDRWYEEYYADFSNSHTRPVTCASTRMLKQASEVYTIEIYKMFEKEYKKFLDCDAFKTCQNGTNEEYDVGIFVNNRSHKVNFDIVAVEVNCSCKRYEFVGILCSHALKVLDFNHIKLIPEKYIMKRWTKNAKIGNVNDRSGDAIETDPSLELRRRYGVLCSRMVRIVTLAAEHEETFQFAMNNSGELLEGIEEKLKAITIGEAPTKSISVVMEPSSSSPVPIEIKRKENERGRRRYPNPLEKKKKKKTVEKKKKIVEKKKSQNQEIPAQEDCQQTVQPPIQMFAASHVPQRLQIEASSINQHIISYAQLLQGTTLSHMDTNIEGGI